MRRFAALCRLAAPPTLALLVLSACRSTPPLNPPPPILVTVSPGSAMFTAWRDTARFTARVSCDRPVSPKVRWTSSNPLVASVDSTGLVTALAAGTTSIVATAVADASAHGVALVTANLHSLPSAP